MWNKKLLVIYDYRICLTLLYVLLVTEYNVVILKQAQFKYQIRIEEKKAEQEMQLNCKYLILNYYKCKK